jgi:hypothetical protein
MAEKNKPKAFVIECPEPTCGNKDIKLIDYVETAPLHSSLTLEADGYLTVGVSDYELDYSDHTGGKLECQCCGMDWSMPKNAKVNWE